MLIDSNTHEKTSLTRRLVTYHSVAALPSTTISAVSYYLLISAKECQKDE